MNLKPISFDVEGLTLRGSVYEPKGGFEQKSVIRRHFCSMVSVAIESTFQGSWCRWPGR